MLEIKYQAEDLVTYVPDLQDNRERAESWDGTGERPFFWCELAPLSGRDASKVRNKALIETRNTSRNKAGDQTLKAADLLETRIVSQYVTRVGGLRLIGRGGKVLLPKSGEDICNDLTDAYPKLRDELRAELFEALHDISKADEGDLKNLRRSSDGSAQLTTKDLPVASGIAPIAQNLTDSAATAKA